MLLSKWLPICLIGFGIVIMAGNVLQCFRLVRNLGWTNIPSKKNARTLHIIYFLLLLFFLLGYIFVEIRLFLPGESMNGLLVGLIFFFGSVFVLIGLVIQLSLGKTVQQSSLEITQTLITAVEARDANLNGHSIHVSRLTMLLYRYLPRELQRGINRSELEYASLLHDIGKLGVPESILNKEGPLDEREWQEIRKHPIVGKEILSSHNGFGNIADWVFYHHERCDGKGYYGVPFERIPLPSRMIAVADTFSALTMNRSYRDAKSYGEAAAILRDCRGTQLDAVLVDIFLRIPRGEVEGCCPPEAMEQYKKEAQRA